MTDTQTLYDALTTPPDLVVRNEGSIFILTPQTVAGDEWLAEHIPADAMTWCNGIVVEHRYIEAIVTGARADGLVVG